MVDVGLDQAHWLDVDLVLWPQHGQRVDLYNELLKEEMYPQLDPLSLFQLPCLSSWSSHCSLQDPPNYDLRWRAITKAYSGLCSWKAIP